MFAGMQPGRVGTTFGQCKFQVQMKYITFFWNYYHNNNTDIELPLDLTIDQWKNIQVDLTCVSLTV
jgi:hypothetical protein